MAALGGEGDVVQRVAAALIAKNKAAWRLLADSPHADELYGEHERGGAAQFAAFETALAAAMERELAAAGIERARTLTQLLLAASFGIVRKAQSVAELGPALRLLVDRLVRLDHQVMWVPVAVAHLRARRIAGARGAFGDVRAAADQRIDLDRAGLVIRQYVAERPDDRAGQRHRHHARDDRGGPAVKRMAGERDHQFLRADADPGEQAEK